MPIRVVSSAWAVNPRALVKVMTARMSPGQTLFLKLHDDEDVHNLPGVQIWSISLWPKVLRPWSALRS